MGELLNRFKIITGEQDDLTASFYIEAAKATVLDYTNRSELIEPLNHIVLELAIQKYRIKDSDGVSSRSEGDVSESYDTSSSVYSTEIPEIFKARLNNYRLLHIARK